ncbi:ClpX C4-type zinc finger protein, partial [Enterocloster lavalensis]
MKGSVDSLTLPSIYCSFCGKSQNDVFRMIAEPSEIFICDRGSELCA